MAWITVGVTAGDDADARRPLRDKGAAVTDALADADFLYRQNPAVQRHHWLEVEVGGS
jgi:hypothetical protein